MHQEAKHDHLRTDEPTLRPPDLPLKLDLVTVPLRPALERALELLILLDTRQKPQDRPVLVRGIVDGLHVGHQREGEAEQHLPVKADRPVLRNQRATHGEHRDLDLEHEGLLEDGHQPQTRVDARELPGHDVEGPGKLVIPRALDLLLAAREAPRQTLVADAGHAVYEARDLQDVRVVKDVPSLVVLLLGRVELKEPAPPGLVAERMSALLGVRDLCTVVRQAVERQD
mmetsp:Transcript_90691/g.282490  ORF Transcript_90691/g.282490 Transcript_90691/m.282490 type:complete len:228 (-) Transcript_90691:827-1510(-)